MGAKRRLNITPYVQSRSCTSTVAERCVALSRYCITMQYLSEKNQGKLPSAQTGARSRFETGPSQTRSKCINHLTEKVSKAHMEHGDFY